MNQNNKTLHIASGIAIGVVLTVLAGLVLSPTSQYVGMMYRGDSLIDQHFIEQMIPHHDGAIVMANMALLKATHPETKALAGIIIEAQSKEVAEMQGWYKDWFGGDVKKGNTYSMMGGMMSQGGMHMGGQEDTQALENAVDFDKAFIEAMIPHHQLAIVMAQMLKFGTDRPEMLSLANDIIESQSREITEMQSWYKNWYR